MEAEQAVAGSLLSITQARLLNMVDTMALEKWTKDSGGNPIAYPLCGYEPVVYAGMGILLRLEYAQIGDQISKPSGAVQLVLTHEGAKLLVRDLLKAIAQTEQPSGQKN